MDGQWTTKWPTWRMDAAALILMAVVGGSAWALHMGPLFQQKGDYQARQADLARVQQQSRQAEQSLATTVSQLAATEEQLAQRGMVLQPLEQINARLARLTSLAGSSRLQVDGLEPGKAVASARFQTVAIRLSGRGSSRDCASFLRGVHEQLPDTQVVSFRLSAGGEEHSAGFECDLLWYAAP